MFEVPEAFTPSLERIVAMKQEDFDRLRNALASTKPSLKQSTLIQQVEAALDSQIPDVAEIVRTIGNLSNARASADVSIERLVQDVSRPLARRTDKPVDLGILEQRLTTLLSIEALVFSARAFDLQHEYDKLFISARIVSDVRPVFNEAGSDLVATIVVHNLNIKYYQPGGEYKEMFIALDEADVQKLRKVLDRADAKVATLESFISKTGVQHLESK